MLPKILYYEKHHIASSKKVQLLSIFYQKHCFFFDSFQYFIQLLIHYTNNFECPEHFSIRLSEVSKKSFFSDFHFK